MASSFLEKLKKGMGVEESEEKNPEKTEEIFTVQQEEEKKPKKEVMTKKIIETKIKKASVKPKTKKKEEVQIEEKLEPAVALVKEEKKKWPQPEGQLAIDVYQSDSELVIQSAIAGVKPEDIDISIDDDVITIRGKRKKFSDEQSDYFYQECYWGAFSRQVISPVEIDPGRVDASLKDGILTIRIPKILRSKKRKIVIKG